MRKSKRAFSKSAEIWPVHGFALYSNNVLFLLLFALTALGFDLVTSISYFHFVHPAWWNILIAAAAVTDFFECTPLRMERPIYALHRKKI